ncbi:hypothetical protein [Aeromonas veronii]|uniref:hypothetical protein n=1 Tax=Aeromonas veronii TaxID=654 RepID=UPI003F7A0542
MYFSDIFFKLFKLDRFFLALALLLFGLTVLQAATAADGQVRTVSEIHGSVKGGGDENNSGACNPQSDEFFPKQKITPWISVPSSRVAEVDYYGRIFEARIFVESRELFLYKVLMNIRGVPSYVSVGVLGEKQLVIDTRKISLGAIFFLQNEAARLIRELKKSEIYHVLSYGGDISIWEHGGKWYFSKWKNDEFIVFEFTERDIGYVCNYNEQGRVMPPIS